MGSFKFLCTLALLFLISGFICTNAKTDPESKTVERISWNDLTNVEWVREDGYYKAKFTERQKELDGKEVIVEGFMFPLEYTRKHRSFLVSASPMGSCFFCGPGEAESMIYVKSAEDVEHTNQTLKVKGVFSLVTDPSQGILYEMDNARTVD